MPATPFAPVKQGHVYHCVASSFLLITHKKHLETEDTIVVLKVNFFPPILACCGSSLLNRSGFFCHIIFIQLQSVPNVVSAWKTWIADRPFQHLRLFEFTAAEVCMGVSCWNKQEHLKGSICRWYSNINPPTDVFHIHRLIAVTLRIIYCKKQI